jgi:autotransporter-associated beta strand protein
MWFRGAQSIELSGPGSLVCCTTLRIPDGGTLVISGAVTGTGALYRGGDATGTLVLNNPGSTYSGTNGGRSDGWITGTDTNSELNNTYNSPGSTAYAFPVVSFLKNDSGGDQNILYGTSVVLMVGSVGGSGKNVTSGPFGTGTVNWQYWGSLANGTPNPLTIGNDFIMEGDMGINGGAGLTLSGDMLVGNRDRGNGGQYRELATSGNVTLSGRLISTQVWGGTYAGLDLQSGTGIVTLSGSNSMLFGLRVTQGTLAAGGNAAFGINPVVLGSNNSAGGTIGLLAGSANGAITVPNPITVSNYGNGTTLGGLPGLTNQNATFSGAISLATNVSLISSATGSSAVTFSGGISGSGLGVNVQGPGNVTFDSANSYTGATVLSGGLLTLDFTQAGAPASNIINPSSALTMSGGALAVNGGGAGSQTFNTTIVNPGGSAIAASAATLALGSITRNVGGTVDFNGAGTISPS